MSRQAAPVVVTAASVMVLGAPIGNLWDIRFDGRPAARVTYHGNKLVTLTGDLVGHRAKAEAAIATIYRKGTK